MKEEIRKTYYENGNIETERSYVDGVEHGPAKGWYESGELSFESFKKDGVPHGLVKNYYENGKLQKEIEYNMGKEHGHQKQWFENGKLKSEGQKKNGEVYAYWNIYNWDERGQDCRYLAENGELVFVEEINPKTSKNNDFKNTIKFTEELKKYIKTHNVNDIYVYPSKYGVWEEFIHKGQYQNKNYTMKISIPLKNAYFEYEGSLSDFIKQIGTKNINQLDNTNLDLGLCGDDGGSWEVDEIIWEEKLSKEEQKKFNQSEILSKWIDEGMQSVDDKIVFEKGCIYEIEVTIEDKVFTLVK